MMNKNIMLYINKLQGFRTAVKNFHWDAKTMSEHELMDSLDELLGDHQDEVAEIAQGIYNIKIKKNELKPRAYSMKTSEKFLKDILQCSERFYKALGDNKKYIGLRSVVEDFIGQINKQNYLLKMCLSESVQRVIREGLMKYGKLIK